MDATRMMAVLMLAAALAACAGPSGTSVDTGLYEDEMATDEAGARPSGMDEEGFQEGTAFGDEFGPGGDVENRVVYFEFDKSDVRAEYLDLVAEHGQYLAANSDARVRLEGHADERGSREYNIGLGERRAQAVRQLLLLQGAAALQISTVSYGEERPAVLGSDEEAWSLNRRVELVYSQ